MPSKVVSWWSKRTSERDALNRALLGVTVRTELELAVADLRRALDSLEPVILEEPYAGER